MIIELYMSAENINRLKSFSGDFASVINSEKIIINEEYEYINPYFKG